MIFKSLVMLIFIIAFFSIPLFAETCGVKSPLITIKFVKKDKPSEVFSRPYSRMYFSVENKSDALITLARIKITLFSKDKMFLRTEELAAAPLRSKDKSIFKQSFDGFDPEEISSWKVELTNLAVQNSKGEKCYSPLTISEYKLIEEK